jgi:hypothetical protein
MHHNFFPENRAFYEIMWKNTNTKDDNKIWRIRFVFWVPKDINTLSDYVILIAVAR